MPEVIIKSNNNNNYNNNNEFNNYLQSIQEEIKGRLTVLEAESKSKMLDKITTTRMSENYSNYVLD